MFIIRVAELQRYLSSEPHMSFSSQEQMDEHHVSSISLKFTLL